MLIPGQATGALAAELLVVAAGTAALVWRLQRAGSIDGATTLREGAPRSSMAYRPVLGLGGPLLVAVAGITLAICVGGGLYCSPVAVAVAYVAAFTSAWVLMIEILR